MKELTNFREAARAVSHKVLAEFAPPGELEISLAYLEPLIEMADQGEVQPTDLADNVGGFGSTDLLVVSVAPMVVQVLRALEGDKSGAPTRAAVEEAIRATRPARLRLLAQIRSPRAKELGNRMEEAIAKAVLEA